MSNTHSAYIIGQITILDQDKWLEYKGKVPATLIEWGGKTLLRGKKQKILNGKQLHSDNVIISFPDTAALNGWFNSPAYQMLIPLRDSAADVDLVSYEAE